MTIMVFYVELHDNLYSHIQYGGTSKHETRFCASFISSSCSALFRRPSRSRIHQRFRYISPCRVYAFIDQSSSSRLLYRRIVKIRRENARDQKL
ncbi:hypothetical protein L1887_16541 [Cichorium endivia]|nr:hypothetical protein L1887_16541 [Cichorium endivia]